MKSFPKFVLASKFAWPLPWLAVSPDAMAQSRAQYDSMVASHAAPTTCRKRWCTA